MLACHATTNGVVRIAALLPLSSVLDATGSFSFNRKGTCKSLATHIMSFGDVYIAFLINWANEESHDIVEVRIVGLQGDVVVPRR